MFQNVKLQNNPSFLSEKDHEIDSLVPLCQISYEKHTLPPSSTLEINKFREQLKQSLCSSTNLSHEILSPMQLSSDPRFLHILH